MKKTPLQHWLNELVQALGGLAAAMQRERSWSSVTIQDASEDQCPLPSGDLNRVFFLTAYGSEKGKNVGSSLFSACWLRAGV